MEMLDEMATDDELLHRIGAMVRAARKDAGLTQIELAALAHMSPTVVGRVELGLQGISALRLARLASLLGLSMDVLLAVPPARGRMAMRA